MGVRACASCLPRMRLQICDLGQGGLLFSLDKCGPVVKCVSTGEGALKWKQRTIQFSDVNASSIHI